MAIITLPTTLLAGTFTIGQKRYDLDEISDPSGNVASRLLGPPRWRLSMSSPDKASEARSKVWQVMLMQLRGKVNHLAAWDIARPAPLGTMRGSLTLSATAAAGATSISVTGGAGQAGTTMLAPDWLQLGSGLGSQTVMVMADATANGSGVIVLTIEPPLRVGFTSGTVVTWDKPLVHYKMISEPANWQYDAGWLTKSGYALDFLEQWQ